MPFWRYTTGLCYQKFYPGLRREEKLKAFYKSSRVFHEVVRVKVEELTKYKERLIADGLLNPEIKRAQHLELKALCLEAAQLFASGTVLFESRFNLAWHIGDHVLDLQLNS